jgi:hypothetical protein
MFGSTLFFAAGAVADAGTAGGAADGSGHADTGAGTGDTGADEGGDTGAGDNQPADDDTAGDGSADHKRAAADPDAPVDLGDGRTVPGKWKNLFDVAEKAGLGKDVRSLYFERQRLNKVIPGGVKAAIEMAETVERFGGVDGIEQIQTDLDTYHQDSELFERGDASWVETAFRENPEAALKAFDNSLAYVGDKHPEHYDHVMAKVVLNTVDNGSPIRDVYALLADPNSTSEQRKQAATKLAEWYNEIKDTARKIPEKKVDARQKQLSDREAQIEQREMGTRYTQVNAQCFPVLKSQVADTMKAEAKLAGVDLDKLATDYPGEFRRMLNDIHDRIKKTAIKDEAFVNKYYVLVKKGDLRRAQDVTNKKHARIVPDIVREVVGESGLFKGSKKKAASSESANAGNKGNQQQVIDKNWKRVTAKPPNSEIDFAKSPMSLTTEGKYVLKNGQRVQVAY